MMRWKSEPVVNPFRELLEKFHSGQLTWVKDPSVRDELIGRTCLGLGLIFQEGDMSARLIIRSVLTEQYPERAISGCIPLFNDHEDTTFADIELVLEKAAIQWEEVHA